jgi:hypothetical protein
LNSDVAGIDTAPRMRGGLGEGEIAALMVALVRAAGLPRGKLPT